MRAAAAVLAALLCASWAAAAAAQKYNAIFNFGDSITDTGNLCTNGKPSQITFTQPPYGETYFGTPTCRCCDGRVIVDFLSSKFGLPFLPPSKSTSADFKKGANMAITGATAMDAPFFRSLGLSDRIWNNGPISFQLQWFQQITSSVCGQDCKSYLGNSLFVFGEFGGNDYNAMLFGNYNTDQASTYTPQIVSTIAAGVEKLVAMGAKDVVVPGVLPIGCFPIYLTIYGTSSSGDYDGLGCLKKFNDLSTNHNSQLKAQLASLQAKYPSARIMYADFYSGVYDMVRSPGSYGGAVARNGAGFYKTCPDVEKLERADQGQEEEGAGGNCWGDGKEGGSGTEDWLEHRLYHDVKLGSVTLGWIPTRPQGCGKYDSVHSHLSH